MKRKAPPKAAARGEDEDDAVDLDDLDADEPEVETSGPRADAERGLQLWREQKWAEAFAHLERAVMSLSGSDPLTKQAFAALDDLEKRGFVGS